ncbi:uncharacterized protein [Halyomorpha halys]|uniref:uncharacterized protein n=1 Tax=Halyomorpha halys TaxID=286706 RepID=UPI0006D528A9|nr:uncharacterized protein LOC106685660 [Halyomorpha halys]
MALTWSFYTILFTTLFGARASTLGDDPLVEKVKTIIANVDDYLATHGMNELLLPDIGIFSIEPIKLRNGGFGQFSTIYVQDATTVNKTQQEDGNLYSFDLKLGLKELLVYYDFNISAIIIKEKGNFTLSVLKNSAQLTGSVSVLNNKICKAKLTNVRVLELEDYSIQLSKDTPALILVSEMIFNIIGPKLVPLLNTALRAALLVPGVQNVFAAIACSELS